MKLLLEISLRPKQKTAFDTLDTNGLDGFMCPMANCFARIKMGKINLVDKDVSYYKRQPRSNEPSHYIVVYEKNTA
jgi:hypothetical protein